MRKVIYCMGQIYYDLYVEREKRGINDIAIIRLEQLSPFPFRSLRKFAVQYENAEHMWAQEEPKNAGCWSYMEPRFRAHFKQMDHKHKEITYAGRCI